MTYNATQQYILDHIDNSGYDGESLNTDKDKLTFLAKTFKDEYGWSIPRVGIQRSLREWLSGLPSSVDVPFYNHDILSKGKEFGLLSDNATEEQEYEFINEWFSHYADQLFILMRQHKIKV